MVHYTLNTGNTIDLTELTVSQAATAIFRRMLKKNGGPIPGRPEFRVTITKDSGSALFVLWGSDAPMLTCAVAWKPGVEEIEAWVKIEKLYLDASDRCPRLNFPGSVPEMPGSLPWSAAVILPAMYDQKDEDVAILADFQRCLVWTMLENQKVD